MIFVDELTPMPFQEFPARCVAGLTVGRRVSKQSFSIAPPPGASDNVDGISDDAGPRHAALTQQSWNSKLENCWVATVFPYVNFAFGSGISDDAGLRQFCA